MRQRRKPVTKAWRPLPRCRCGKAIYATGEDAERQRRKLDLEATHRCRFGNHHITSKAQRQRRTRRSLPMITTCPVCRQVAEDDDPASLVDELASCTHPVHWPDRDPEAPYFPHVAVPLAGQAGAGLSTRSAVVTALFAAAVDVPTADAFAVDFASCATHLEALACVQRWVDVS